MPNLRTYLKANFGEFQIKRCARQGCDKIIYFDASDLPHDSQLKGRAVRGVYKSKKYRTTNCRVKRWQRAQKKKKTDLRH